MTEYGNQFAPPPPAQQYPGPAPGYPAVPPVPTPYGAAPYGAQPNQPNQQGLPAYPGSSMDHACRLCGSVPAANVTFRQHTGMILMMRFGSLSGPFCRDCGVYVFRKMTAHTLLAGWWGWASFFITPVILLLNLARRGKVARLAAPIRQLANRQPADPGKPLYQRFAIVGLLVPLAVLVLIVAAATDSSSTDSSSGNGTLVGSCVQEDSAGTNAKLVDCGQPHQGVVTQVANTSQDCPSDTLFEVSRSNDITDASVLCVGRG